VHNAISFLSEKEVYKFSLLIEALERISKNHSSRITTKILNEVEKYLNRCLTDLNTDDSEYLEEEPVEWLQKSYKWLQRRFDIHTKINSLNLNRKKELLALGYFLQGELSTQEEFEYIRKVLRSYLTRIEQFRNSPPSE
jgi:hypothetical protein